MRWGLGDFVWIYVAGIVASVVGVSIGFAITGDTADHTGARHDRAVDPRASSAPGSGASSASPAPRARSRPARLRAHASQRARLVGAVRRASACSSSATALIEPLRAHRQRAPGGRRRPRQGERGQARRLRGRRRARRPGVRGALVPGAAAAGAAAADVAGRGRRSCRRSCSRSRTRCSARRSATSRSCPRCSCWARSRASSPTRKGDLSASIMMHIGFNLVTTLLAL